MIKFCRQNKDNVLNSIKSGKLDAVHLSATNFVDEIILSMNNNGVLDCLEKSIKIKDITINLSLLN